MLQGYKNFVIVYKSKETGAEYIHKSIGKTKEGAEKKFRREYGEYYDIIKVESRGIGR